MSGPGAGPASVVIPNWNGRHHLESCLPALSVQTYGDIQVVVVDNGSSDDSVSWLGERWPDVVTVGLTKNLGFAAACNRGIEATDGPWVAILNNDTVPEKTWLEALVDRAASDDRVASVASLQLFMDRPQMVNSAGIAVDSSGIAWDRLGGAAAETGAREATVFGASAGAALFRRAALDDTAEPCLGDTPQCFDERFFMFMEDVDLAWRLRLRGWQAAYAPDARVLHAGSATAGEGSPFKNKLLARNKIWTVAKDYPGRSLAARLPVVLAYDIGSVPYRYVVQRQGAALHGRIEALRRLGPVLRQRRRIQSRRKVEWAAIAEAMEPLEPPWAVPRRYRHLSTPASHRGARGEGAGSNDGAGDD